MRSTLARAAVGKLEHGPVQDPGIIATFDAKTTSEVRVSVGAAK